MRFCGLCFPMLGAGTVGGQKFDLPQVDPAQEYGRQGQREQLCGGEGPPDGGQTAGPGEQKGNRQQDHQLAHHGHQQAEDSMSQRLEHRRAHNGVPREQEAEGDDPQGWDADGQQITGVILRPEQVQQDMGGELEGQQTGQHDSYRSSHTELDGLDDPVRTACPVVVGHDGHHGRYSGRIPA